MSLAFSLTMLSSVAEAVYPGNIPDGAAYLPPQNAKCWTGGSAERFMKVCVSNHGNLSFESPAGSKTLLQSDEGYAICSNSGTHGYDSGDYQSAWGATAVTYPTTATALITRTTSDGRLKLEMRISRDLNEFDTIIETTVTNLSNSTLAERAAGALCRPRTRP